MTLRNENPVLDQSAGRRRWRYRATCFLLMVALAALSYTGSGLAWWTLFAIAVAISCPIVMAIAWWQGERAQREVKRALAQLPEIQSIPGKTHGP
ncbi:MAG: hypothetical protein HY308_11275 [Gammaproteobacteria bacterium]|nr:hypothetical protein [Gammaproteobacteria bacterium]